MVDKNQWLESLKKSLDEWLSKNDEHETNKFLDNLSDDTSYHKVMTHEDGVEPKPGHISVYSDHGDTNDDDHPVHSGPDGEKKFHAKMDDHQQKIDKHMADRGYKKIGEDVGSGDGMHYWASHYHRRHLRLVKARTAPYKTVH